MVHLFCLTRSCGGGHGCSFQQCMSFVWMVSLHPRRVAMPGEVLLQYVFNVAEYLTLLCSCYMAVMKKANHIEFTCVASNCLLHMQNIKQEYACLWVGGQPPWISIYEPQIRIQFRSCQQTAFIHESSHKGSSKILPCSFKRSFEAPKTQTPPLRPKGPINLRHPSTGVDGMWWVERPHVLGNPPIKVYMIYGIPPIKKVKYIVPWLVYPGS